MSEIEVPPDQQQFDRVDLLKNSVSILRKMEYRLLVERWKPRENDHDFLAYVRAYAQLITSVNAIAKDLELEMLKQEIEELKEATV